MALKIWEWLAQLYAALAIMPFLSFLAIWLVFYFTLHDKKRSTKIAVDTTTVFLLGSVYTMCKNSLSSVFLFWFAVLLLLIFAGWIGREQNMKRGRIDPVKIFRVVWRFAFLLFSVLYVLLLLVGMIQYILEI